MNPVFVVTLMVEYVDGVQGELDEGDLLCFTQDAGNNNVPAIFTTYDAAQAFITDLSQYVQVQRSRYTIVEVTPKE